MDATSAEATAGAEQAGLTSTDGLTSISGITPTNGLLASGVSTTSGMSGNGISSTNGLITTADGRTTISYLAKCALSSTQSFTKTYSGTAYTFTGSLGLTPTWLNGSLSALDQEKVSACMLAMINVSGNHVALYLDSPDFGFTTNATYSVQEAAFYGNIFTSGAPKAYACLASSAAGVAPGRLCGSSTSCQYKNTGICSSQGNRAQGTGTGLSGGQFAGFINPQAISATPFNGGPTTYPNDTHAYYAITVWESGH